MKTIIVDADIILRFLRNDVPTQFKIAKDIFESAQRGEVLLYIDELVVAEVVWSLKSSYKEHASKIAKTLLEIISQNFTTNPRKKILIDVLNFYRGCGLSYVDCWLFVLGKDLDLKLETFDQKLKKLAH